MKAVMWTDVFQIVIMIVGLIAVIVRGVVINGGVWNVWEQAQKGGRIHFLEYVSRGTRVKERNAFDNQRL